jgi:myo-inositol-1(or 4)-monophosphatase
MTSAPRRERPPLDARALARIARRAGKLGLAGGPAAPGRAHAETLRRQILAAVKEDVGYLAPQVGVLAQGLPVPRRATWLLAVSAMDGSDAYAAGIPTWSVSLAVVRAGAAPVAAVFLPALGEMYVASGDVLRRNNEHLIRAESTLPPRGFVLGQADFQRRPLLGLRRRARASGSPAYHLCLVARGDAQGAVLGRPHLWDVAGGAALVRAAGGDIVELSGGRSADLEALADGSPSRSVLVAVAAGADASLLRGLRRR